MKFSKLEDLYNFEITKLMYQFTHSKLLLNFNYYFAYSSDVSSYSTRHTSSNDIFLPRFMSSKTQHSIKYIGAKIWNNIPLISKMHLTQNLKSLIKSFSLVNTRTEFIISYHNSQLSFLFIAKNLAVQINILLQYFELN